MKTSLLIDDAVFKTAKAEAARSGRTLSEVISEWARLGRDLTRNRGRAGSRRPRTVLELGGPARVDLSSRRHWMDTLDER